MSETKFWSDMVDSKDHEIAALKAERDTLQGVVTSYVMTERELKAERDELKSKLLMAEGCSALAVTGIDAHAVLIEASKDLAARLIAVEAGRDRMRAALEGIAYGPAYWGLVSSDGLSMQMIARRALDGEE
jgi:hypothetical protein